MIASAGLADPGRAAAQTRPAPAPVRIAPLPAGRPERLDALVAEAVRFHPALRRAGLQVAAAREVPSRAGALPDPMFGVALQNIRTDEPGLSTSPMSAVALSLEQEIPFPGKLGQREALAGATAASVQTRLGALKVAVALNVRRAYWRLQYAEAAERITTSSEKVVDTLANTVHVRFSVGQGAQQDALQSQVAHSRLRTMLQRRRQAVRTARRMLNAAVGRRPNDTVSAADAPPSRARLDRAALEKRVRRNNPNVRVRMAAVETARRSVAEARKDRLPNFKVGVQYRIRQAAPGDMSHGADMFGVSFGMTLPVWMGNKQNARVRQSYAELGAASADVKDVTLDAVTRVQELVDSVERLNQELELYKKELLPETDQSLDASIEDYAFGRVGFVSVLKNWEMDLEARLVFASLLSERAIALAEIDALAGKQP